MTPTPFKALTELDEATYVVRIEGELDMNTAAALERELETPLAADGSSLLIDLSRCEFIDSTGIALIVRAWQALGSDTRFALCGVGSQVERVLDITGLETAIPTHASREEALSRLRR